MKNIYKTFFVQKFDMMTVKKLNKCLLENKTEISLVKTLILFEEFSSTFERKYQQEN